MKVHISKAAVIFICITIAYVHGNDTPETPSSTDTNSTTSTNSTISTNTTDTNTTDTNTTSFDSNVIEGGGWGSMFGRLGRCFFACRRPNSPAECMCDNKDDCETKQCGEGEVCKMIRGRFSKCVKDKSVCDLPKSTVACDAKEPSYFYNKYTQRCEKFGQGECGGNLNMFQHRGQCFRTCRPRLGKVFIRPRPRPDIFGSLPDFFGQRPRSGFFTPRQRPDFFGPRPGQGLFRSRPGRPRS